METETITSKIDKIITHKYLGYIVMIFVLYFVYQLTFSLGKYPQNLVYSILNMLRIYFENSLPDGHIKSLVLFGIIDGVGGVLSFVPLIFIVFLQIAFLNKCGYTERMAYMLNKVFKLFGLHGLSIMPFIIGGGIAGGCAVPGILATRSIENPKERLATMLAIPFLCCGAKLPVFILFVGIFFPKHEAVILLSLTVIAWIVALVFARILRSTLIRGKGSTLPLALSYYKTPALSAVLKEAWSYTYEYIKKAGTVILLFSVILWAAMSYPVLPKAEQVFYEYRITSLYERANFVENNIEAQRLMNRAKSVEVEYKEVALRYSIAGRLTSFIEPVTMLAGFDWKINTALLGGFAAKEVIIANLATTYALSSAENGNTLAQRIGADKNWTYSKIFAFLIFVLLYSPCVASLVAISHESGSKDWALFSLTVNTILAFTLATITYRVLNIFV